MTVEPAVTTLPLNAFRDDTGRTGYRVVRTIHTLWTGVVFPLSLSWFHREYGGAQGYVFLPLLWGMTAVVMAEQYFYPLRLSEACLTTGTVVATLLLALIVGGPRSFMMGFYLTFMAALCLVSLTAVALFFTPLWQALKLNVPIVFEIRGFKDFLYFYFIWALLCGPLVMGPFLFANPLLEMKKYGLLFYGFLGMMLLQAASALRQVILAMIRPNDPKVAPRRKIFEGIWGMVAAIVWLAVFCVSLPLMF